MSHQKNVEIRIKFVRQSNIIRIIQNLKHESEKADHRNVKKFSRNKWKNEKVIAPSGEYKYLHPGYIVSLVIIAEQCLVFLKSEYPS